MLATIGNPLIAVRIVERVASCCPADDASPAPAIAPIRAAQGPCTRAGRTKLPSHLCLPLRERPLV